MASIKCILIWDKIRMGVLCLKNSTMEMMCIDGMYMYVNTTFEKFKEILLYNSSGLYSNMLMNRLYFQNKINRCVNLNKSPSTHTQLPISSFLHNITITKRILGVTFWAFTIITNFTDKVWHRDGHIQSFNEKTNKTFWPKRTKEIKTFIE